MGVRAQEEGCDECVNEAGVDVADVSVDEADDVTSEVIDALPEILSLAAFEAGRGQDVS